MRTSNLIALMASVAALCSCSVSGGPGTDTPVPTQAELAVSCAPGWPTATAVEPGRACFAIAAIVLTAGASADVSADAVSFRASGTINEVSCLSGFRLCMDDGDGVFDQSGDVPFCFATGFSADDGVLSFVPLRVVQAGTAQTWFLVADLNGSPSVGQTVHVSVPDASYVTAASSAVPVVPSGLPVEGGTFTIGHVWSQPSTAGSPPPDLREFSLVHDTVNDRLVVWGGLQSIGGLNPKVFALDMTQNPPSWSELSSGGPAPRYGHAAAFDASSCKMVIFGGWNPNTASALDDTWSFRLQKGVESWEQIVNTGTPMQAVLRACAAWPAGTQDMILFGGCDREDGSGPVTHFGGFHKFRFNATGGAWSYAGSPSVSGAGLCMIEDRASTRVIVFGGRTAPGGTITYNSWAAYYNWSNNTYGTLSCSNQPSARWRAAAAVSHSDSKAFLFGGEGASGVLGDVRTLDLTTLAWSEPAPVIGGPPADRFGHCAAFAGSVPGSFLLFWGSPSGGGVWSFR